MLQVHRKSIKCIDDDSCGAGETGAAQRVVKVAVKIQLYRLQVASLPITCSASFNIIFVKISPSIDHPHPMALLPRDVYGPDRYSNYDSPWNNYGRWIVTAIIIVAAVFFFFIIAFVTPILVASLADP